MLEVQRSERESLREEEGCRSPSTHLLGPVDSGDSVSGWKPAERSVSFNRDVHVKRIGRGPSRVTAALVGDGEGRLIPTPVRKESIASRSKEDLAQEAALVLQQAGSTHCVAHDNRRLPGRFSTLPARGSKKRPEISLNVRRNSEEIGVTSEDLATTPKAKKKALERSGSDASAKKLKGPLARLFSPKLDRKRKPVGRSVSDVGASGKPYRKRSGSESEAEVSHLATLRTKKPLSPIIEASPQVDQQPFNFAKSSENLDISTEAKRAKQETSPSVDVGKLIDKFREKEGLVDNERSKRVSRSPSPVKERKTGSVDEVDASQDPRGMLRNSRYDFQVNEQSTIHKMIHRLSNDRSPPPQLTRAMVSPSPGFGHNNNRPFSYTRPNETRTSPIPQSNVIYAQVQPEKKKAQRSHSDSDEGLGLERKDSSRENSPAEKEYRRTDYSYSSDLRRNNEINTLKSRYEVDRKTGVTTTRFGSSVNDQFRRHDFDAFDEIDRNLFEKSDNDKKHASTIIGDIYERGRGDGMDSKRRETPELSRQNQIGISSNKTSELSARRDLLESRIKSRLLADEMFAKSNNGLLSGNNIKKMEHEIIDKPIVPSPVTPNRVSSPKRYTDTYITETRTNSNGEKYIFEKEIHDENGKVYGYEKKITNKIPSDGYMEIKPREGYSIETRTDKYGDKYIVETRTHESFADDFKPSINDTSRTSPDDGSRFYPRNTATTNGNIYRSTNQHYLLNNRQASRDGELRKNEAWRGSPPSSSSTSSVIREHRVPITKKNPEIIRGMSKSTQRLDQIGQRSKALRSEFTTRSHENLSSRPVTDYANTRSSPFTIPGVFGKRHLESLDERPNDDYDTDISQLTNSHLESKYSKETRISESYSQSNKNPIHDDYDSSPLPQPPGPTRIRGERGNGTGIGGYSSTRYDSDTTTRESVRYENRCYDESSRILKKDQTKLDEDSKKNVIRRSRNRLDYFDDSDARESSTRCKKSVDRSETFEEGPARPPRTYHESKTRHVRQETRGHTERQHRETRLSMDPDRKDRLADSGIENDYRRDSQEVDRREQLESEDEGFLTKQFIKHERRHTDRSLDPAERKYEKYSNESVKSSSVVTSKPPSGPDKKYEKKATKKGGTMSKVKQLFSKKEKKVKEGGKQKKIGRSGAGSSGAFTDDEVTMRYREYRGDMLRSAKSARDLASDLNQEDYSQRRRLSTPSGSPSPPRPSRLSRSTGTLTRDEDEFCENTLTRKNRGQEAAARKGWLKSLSRKNKSNAKPIDKKKQRIPESEILTTGTEDEEASSAPERISVQKSLRFFGDTDQESISSNRERRNRRANEQASRRDVTSTSRRTFGILSPPRKPPRLLESALSSGESTTGDSSQQSQNSQRSQRSVVYLHAATVGEIPGPNERRRAASREELNRPLQSHTRTVSRSVSVLAPWKPRHYREPFEINYDQQQQHHKPMVPMRRRQRSRETLSRRGKEPRRGKDNLSKTGTINRSTLKSKDKQKGDRTVSMESLATKSRSVNSRPELSRSTSVPRDPNKTAGWFKLKTKKSRA
ncbi:LOW QUALITY PROTEIN: microtubule-associated protein futsch [Prorops nasuta]|uniref:LOW QUALITY PROTEIN: microtubule-associated protein futsch n=1 Tax=Prorops nasuta TaxID=863751 RepID=UPI0034CFB4E7